MAYQDFLKAFAQIHGIESADTLLSTHADRYSFQLKVEERAQQEVAQLKQLSRAPKKGKRTLEVGCSFAGLSLAMAKLGATAVAVDTNQKWLGLADALAHNEAEITLVRSGPQYTNLFEVVSPFAPFDLIVLGDIFAKLPDPTFLAEQIKPLVAPGGNLFFSIRNEFSLKQVTHNVVRQLDAARISTRATTANKPPYTSTYPRRWLFYRNLFTSMGTPEIALLDEEAKRATEITRHDIQFQLRAIRHTLTRKASETGTILSSDIRASLNALEAEVVTAHRLLNHTLFRTCYLADKWIGVAGNSLQKTAENAKRR